VGQGREVGEHRKAGAIVGHARPDDPAFLSSLPIVAVPDASKDSGNAVCSAHGAYLIQPSFFASSRIFFGFCWKVVLQPVQQT